jgi:hypothetical protein
VLHFSFQSNGFVDELEKSCADHIPVALVNCQVKETPSQYVTGGGHFEIVASTRCRVKQSPTKEFVVSSTSNASAVINLTGEYVSMNNI